MSFNMKTSIDSKIITYIKENSLLVLYVFFFFLLLTGVYSQTGTKYFHFLFLYLGSLIFFYVLFQNFFFNKLNFNIPIPEFKFSHYILSAFVISSIIFHFIYLGEIPVISAWQTNDDVLISKIRNNVTLHCPTYINYLSSFTIKGFLPFLLLHTYITKKKFEFWVLISVGLFYTISLLQKSYCVTMLIPLWCFLLLKKEKLKLFLLSLLMALSLGFLVVTANPPLRGDKLERAEVFINDPDPFEKKSEFKKEKSQLFETTNVVYTALFNRIIFTPGKIVSMWFELIPEKFEYLNGCGYSFIAKMKGCEFREYSSILYDYLYPNYTKQGLHGTVVVASFMHDFANFGALGLLLSGCFLSIILLVVNLIFKGFNKMKFVINFLPLLTLFTAAYTTTLLSHGWAILILLFYIYKKDLIAQYES